MGSSHGTVQILFVDDRPDTVNLFGTLFGFAGYTTRIALSGYEGLELAIELRPLVICSDIEMPGMSGFQFAQALRSTPATSNSFLIAISGSDEPELLEESRTAGFDLCLRKPVAFQVLLRHIEEFLKTIEFD